MEWVPFSNFTNFYGLEMVLLYFHPDNEKRYLFLIKGQVLPYCIKRQGGYIFREVLLKQNDFFPLSK